ncbi:uncharacterized protein V3H82_026221 isoform 2-T2 [Fundulus diaphanus]
MEKAMELKMLLESSLKRIFQATVTDILVSVEQTLSEYQGTIQTIQTENEGLKRLLSAQRSAESLHEGLLSSDASEEDGGEQFSGSDWDNHPVTSPNTMRSKYSSDKTCLRKKNESKPKKNASSPPFSLQTDQFGEQSCVDKSSRLLVSVKTEPKLEESVAADVCQPSLNQMRKLVKNESSEVTGDASTNFHPIHPSRHEHESRGSDHSVKVTVVSKGCTQEEHFIETQEEGEAEALPGSEGDGLSQSEVSYALKCQEAELDQRRLEGQSTQDVEQREGTLEQNNSPVVAQDTQEQSSKCFSCPTCPMTFSQAPSLNTHIKTHGMSKDHSCNVCGKNFKRAKDLKYHNYIHTGEKPYGCSICNKTFSHPDLLSRHRRTHPGEKPHRCQQCSDSFRDTRSLHRHMRIHTGERPHSCTQCGKRFSSIGHLKEHHRIHTGERPHSCTQCGKRFSNIGHLKVHYRIHTGERPYDCKQCRKTFNQAGHLKVHMRVHTREAPYRCEECGKKFTTSSSLKMHLQIHTQQQYSCTYCKKICTTSRYLKLHMKKHTTEKVFFCSQCGKIYTDTQSLKKHLKSHTSQE